MLRLLGLAGLLWACQGRIQDPGPVGRPGPDAAAGADGGGPDALTACGNGLLDPGETCDGDCPTSCDDDNPCTIDVAQGDAAACTLSCRRSAVGECGAADACCPAGCSPADDGDCSATCGDGTVDPGETCDPAATCPASCDDGLACTSDLMTGSAANCNARCVSDAISACAGGDGCCPSACTSLDDADCPAVCGNALVEAGETCDGDCPASCDDGMACTSDVLTGSAAACDVACVNEAVAGCVNGDGCCPGTACTSLTDTDCPPRCGNGVVEAGETCDGDCPTGCDDGDPCTTDTFLGSIGDCTAACRNAPPEGCVGGAGCCPIGCAPLASAVCEGGAGEMCTLCAECDTLAAVCGNGACDAGETSASCHADCGPSPWPPSWTTWEEQVLAEINARRARGDDCRTRANPARPALTLNAQLRRAAQLHSWDQVYSGYFAHDSCNGRSPWDRAAAQGTSAGGETLAGGYPTPAATVDGWMGSEGHCLIITGDYAEAGIGYAVEGGSVTTGMYR